LAYGTGKISPVLKVEKYLFLLGNTWKLKLLIDEYLHARPWFWSKMILKTEWKIKFFSYLVIEAEAANKDGISVEIVELEDGVGGLLGLRVPKINVQYYNQITASLLSSNQGCGSGYAFWMRIRIREGKNVTQYKVKNFHVLLCWMLSLESWRLLL
jgi:hypothetical protein